MKTCVVIPTYNESKEIGNVIDEIRKLGLQTIVVDDGSTDDTSIIAKQSGAIVLVNHKNEGKGSSLAKGFNFAIRQGFDAIVTMDGDGQHKVEEILNFIQRAKASSASIFIGNRMHRSRGMPVIRWLTNKFMSWLISKVVGQYIPDTQCGFRLFKIDVLRKIKIKTFKFEIESEIIITAARLGYAIESIPIHTIYRGQKSRINPFIDTLRFIRFISGELWTTKH